MVPCFDNQQRGAAGGSTSQCRVVFPSSWRHRLGAIVAVHVRVRVLETLILHNPRLTLHRLDHENLDVYRCAIEFLAFAFEVTSSLPRGEGELRDQLKRAAISVVLDIAEGIGKPTVADRARYHAIARGSGHGVRCAGRRLRYCPQARAWSSRARQRPAGTDRLNANQDVPLTAEHVHEHEHEHEHEHVHEHVHVTGQSQRLGPVLTHRPRLARSR